MAEAGLGIQRVGLQPGPPFPVTPELSVSSSSKSGQLRMWKAPGLSGLSRQRSIFPLHAWGRRDGGACYRDSGNIISINAFSAIPCGVFADESD